MLVKSPYVSALKAYSENLLFEMYLDKAGRLAWVL